MTFIVQTLFIFNVKGNNMSKNHHATGHSQNFDFGEAIKDAIAKLPPEPPSHNPDVARKVIVTEISATSGGNIAPSLAVTVRAD